MNDPSRIPDFHRGGGLLPAIAQDAVTGEVLMLAWMNEASYRESIETGRAVYFSRSRGRLWQKGEVSGHVQMIESIHVDCDADAILLRVHQQGAACHEGFRSCFFRRRTDGDGWVVETQPLVDAHDVYPTSTKESP